MSEKDKNNKYADFVIHTAVYKTKLTRKHVDRKPWEKPNEKQIRAFIPGTVKDIMVKTGDEVEVDQPLLILEAMKMNNIIRAPKAGKVKTIAISTEERAKKNQLLIEFE